MLLLLAAVCLSSEATEDASGTMESLNESTVDGAAVSADGAAEPPNQTMPEHENDTATSDVGVVHPTDAENSPLEQTQQVRANETVGSLEMGLSAENSSEAEVAVATPPEEETSEAREGVIDAASATQAPAEQATSEELKSEIDVASATQASAEQATSEAREDEIASATQAPVAEPTSEAPEVVIDGGSATVEQATSEEPATPSPTASPAPTAEAALPPQTAQQDKQEPATRNDARRPARVNPGNFGVDEEEAVKKEDPVVTEDHSPFSALVALVVAVAIGCAIAYGLYVTFASEQRPDDLEERVPFNYSLSSKREKDDMEKLGFNRL